MLQESSTQEEKQRADDRSYVLFLINSRMSEARDRMERAIKINNDESIEYWKLELEYSAGLKKRFGQETTS